MGRHWEEEEGGRKGVSSAWLLAWFRIREWLVLWTHQGLRAGGLVTRDCSGATAPLTSAGQLALALALATFLLYCTYYSTSSGQASSRGLLAACWARLEASQPHRTRPDRSLLITLLPSLSLSPAFSPDQQYVLTPIWNLYKFLIFLDFDQDSLKSTNWISCR